MKDEIIQKFLNKEIYILQDNSDLPLTINDILLDYITNLQEENQSLLKKSYKDDVVITKAIEYVKSKKAIINTDYIRIFDLFEIDEQGYTEELLNILKGENNE